jgi:hypothetical protein
MIDPEEAAGSRYKIESRELRRGHRALAAQFELVVRELERCSDLDRQGDLRVERGRITELLAVTEARLSASWDRSQSSARGTCGAPTRSLRLDATEGTTTKGTRDAAIILAAAGS